MQKTRSTSMGQHIRLLKASDDLACGNSPGKISFKKPPLIEPEGHPVSSEKMHEMVSKYQAYWYTEVSGALFREQIQFQKAGRNKLPREHYIMPQDHCLDESTYAMDDSCAIFPRTTSSLAMPIGWHFGVRSHASAVASGKSPCMAHMSNRLDSGSGRDMVLVDVYCQQPEPPCVERDLREKFFGIWRQHYAVIPPAARHHRSWARAQAIIRKCKTKMHATTLLYIISGILLFPISAPLLSFLYYHRNKKMRAGGTSNPCKV